MARKRIGTSIPKASVDDMWQRMATSAAIVAARALIRDPDAAIPPTTPVSRLSDVELGWLTAATLFAWIKTRAEQATAQGWDMETTLRSTALDPQPWDAGAVESILPELAELSGAHWEQPLKFWTKYEMVSFLLEAFRLIEKAMTARDVGGGITTRRKSLDEMQRTASAEAGGPLMTPGEMNDSIPF